MDSIIGTVIRFSSRGGTVDVTIDQDNPATRDLVSRLPLTLQFEDFAGREKIAYPSRKLRTAGAPVSSAGAGDLAIYVPWGNIAFFYEGQRGTPTDQIVHLGTFDATRAQLEALEDGDVTLTRLARPHRPGELAERSSRNDASARSLSPSTRCWRTTHRQRP